MILVLGSMGMSEAANASVSFDQKLEGLYAEVATRFSENADFENKKLWLSRKHLPEYQMPSTQTFKTVMKAYCNAMFAQPTTFTCPDRYTFVDYSQNATIRRLYVYDLKNKNFIYNTWGSHGEGSVVDLELKLKDLDPREKSSKKVLHYHDENTTAFFSNIHESFQSSVGMVRVADSPYYSQLMKKLGQRMFGLDGELNDQLESRGVVLHRGDIRERKVARKCELETSEGCVMFPNAFEQELFSESEGGPLLLYHDRMETTRNNEAHEKQLQFEKEISSLLEQKIVLLALQYRWSTDELAQAQERGRSWLKKSLSDKIEGTYRYFQTASRFVNQPLLSEDDCAARLGI